MSPSSVFILGRTPELAAAELSAVLPRAKFSVLSPQALWSDLALEKPAALLARLGGTVKIGELVAPRFSAAVVANDLATRPGRGKVLFGVSRLGRGAGDPSARLGLEAKRLLKQRGINARLVTSRASQLPAAAINRHGATEYVVLPDHSLARIAAAQDVDDFTRRDVGRPHRDVKSGTLPPKLARMMVNLARVPAGGTLLDPFCGSGTILTEALLAGITSVIGADVSPQAVSDSQANLRWLQQHYPAAAAARWQVVAADVRQLAEALAGQRVDAVATEPYLGPPRRGRETRQQLMVVMAELAALYRDSFLQFALVLAPAGLVVFAEPLFAYGGGVLALALDDAITRCGFTRAGGPYPYHRPDQHVGRRISVWIKK